MKVIGIAMVKDEADVIKATVEHMLTQVDEVIVADNGSTDGTRDILESLPITLIDDPDPAYYQSKKMTDLAKVARNAGADWVVPFDADEIWYSPNNQTVGDVLRYAPVGWLAVTADLYDHVSSSQDNPDELNPVKRIGWRRINKGVLPKVACRYRDDLIIQQGNHGVSYNVPFTYRTGGLLEIRHFPYRSADQFCRKAKNGAAAYAATTLSEDVGAHWRGYGAILASQGEEVVKTEIYHKWFYLDDPDNDETVVYDPFPIMV